MHDACGSDDLPFPISRSPAAVKLLLSLLCLVGLAMPGTLMAQNVAGTDPYTNLRIESVDVRIANPPDDEALLARIEDEVRRAEKVLQEMTDQHIERLDEILQAKEEELLEV